MSKGRRSSSASGTSGDAGRPLTTKQQRLQRREERVAAFQREQTRRKRAKVAWWGGGSLVAAGLVAAVVAALVLAPPPSPRYDPGTGDGSAISGVERFDNGAQHVEGPVDYPQTPPAGGAHAPIWLTCGVYTEEQPNVNAVHSMEHGAVWITYDPERVGEDEVAELRAQMPSTYAILSPFPGMESPITVTAWNAQLQVDAADDERIPAFFTDFWRSQLAPEPNATCSGGIVGPGAA